MSLMMVTIFPDHGEPTLSVYDPSITVLRPSADSSHVQLQFGTLAEFDAWLSRVIDARAALPIPWDDRPDDDNLAFPNDDLNDRGDGVGSERGHPQPLDPGVAGLSMETVALLVGLGAEDAAVDRAVEMERDDG